jgi:hypothetical protein
MVGENDRDGARFLLGRRGGDEPRLPFIRPRMIVPVHEYLLAGILGVRARAVMGRKG